MPAIFDLHHWLFKTIFFVKLPNLVSKNVNIYKKKCAGKFVNSF